MGFRVDRELEHYPRDNPPLALHYGFKEARASRVSIIPKPRQCATHHIPLYGTKNLQEDSGSSLPPIAYLAHVQ